MKSAHCGVPVRLGMSLIAGLSVVLSFCSTGCSQKEAVDNTAQLEEAPNVYGNALNRAKAVSGKVERRSEEGLNGKDAVDKATGE